MNRTILLPLAILAFAAVTLSGCGRKGDLDVPGAPPAEVGKPVKKQVEDRPFFLDPLL